MEVSMQSSDARRLRERWGNKPCDHPNFDKEYNLGADTGDMVCTQCGEVFSKSEIRKLESSKKTKQS